MDASPAGRGASAPPRGFLTLKSLPICLVPLHRATSKVPAAYVRPRLVCGIGGKRSVFPITETDSLVVRPLLCNPPFGAGAVFGKPRCEHELGLSERSAR